MDGAGLLMAGDAETMAERVGSLPDAPLAMPKQRLEGRSAGVIGLIARIAGRAAAAGGQPRRSGQ